MQRCITFVLVAALASALFAADPESDGLAEDKLALADLQSFIGNWKGVGQIRRGSTEGAWIEEAEWAWKFSDDSAAITFSAPKGKYYVGGKFLPPDDEGRYVLVAQRPDDEGADRFVGKLDDDGKLVLHAEEPAEGRPARISVRLVARGKRLIVLYERALPGDRFTRMAEVGYTRKGSGFGKGGSTPECIVTGGGADIPVTYQGETYYVCCTGCRDYFLENPEEVLEEYRERLAKRKEKGQD